VLPELSNMLGGAYRRDATFSTSATELFQKLDRSEQELLKKYFYARVALLKSESPELRAYSQILEGILVSLSIVYALQVSQQHAPVYSATR